jgi:hypothetical protein
MEIGDIVLTRAVNSQDIDNVFMKRSFLHCHIMDYKITDIQEKHIIVENDDYFRRIKKTDIIELIKIEDIDKWVYSQEDGFEKWEDGLCVEKIENWENKALGVNNSQNHT